MLCLAEYICIYIYIYICIFVFCSRNIFGRCRCKVCWSHHVFISKACQHVSVVASFCTEQALQDAAAAIVLDAIVHNVVLCFVCSHVVWIEGSQTFPVPRFSDKLYCLAVLVYVTERVGWAEWWILFLVWSLSAGEPRRFGYKMYPQEMNVN